MKTIKKAVSLLLCFLTLSALCSCARSERIDYSELDRRLKKDSARYKVNEKELLFSDSVYFAFLSLRSQDDILLTMKEDTEKKLTQVTVTASGDDGSEEFKQEFTAFACAVINAFAPEKDAGTLAETQREYTEELFSECFKNAESGHYTLELFSDPLGISVILTRV